MTEFNFDLGDDNKSVVTIDRDEFPSDNKTEVMTEFNFDLEDDNKSELNIITYTFADFENDMPIDDLESETTTILDFNLEDDSILDEQQILNDVVNED
jgi:hypothetical protein